MVEKICKRVSDLCAQPRTFVIAVFVQLMWMLIGSLTHKDPFPFVFMLTVSNVLQLLLIFIIAIAQRDQHKESREHHRRTHAILEDKTGPFVEDRYTGGTNPEGYIP